MTSITLGKTWFKSLVKLLWICCFPVYLRDLLMTTVKVLNIVIFKEGPSRSYLHNDRGLRSPSINDYMLSHDQSSLVREHKDS